MKVEHVACSGATKEAIWFSSFLHDLNLTPRVDDAVEMCDKTTVI